MDSKAPVTRAGGEGNVEGWVATFTILDVSSTISSSQLQRLVASIAKIWRWTRGRSS